MASSIPTLDNDPEFQAVLNEAREFSWAKAPLLNVIAIMFVGYPRISEAVNSDRPAKYLSDGGPGGKGRFPSEVVLHEFEEIAQDYYEQKGIQEPACVRAIFDRYWEIYSTPGFVEKLRGQDAYRTWR